MAIFAALTHLMGGLRRHEGVSDDLGAALVLATIRHELKAMPEQGATGSRDYGRGYAQAIRDVEALLG